MPAVAELLRRARSRQRVGHHGAREGASRGVLVLVHADADVLHDAHVGRVAPGLARALGHALAAPGDLRGGTPVQRRAVRGLAGQAQHPRAERAEVERHRGRLRAQAHAAQGHRPTLVLDAPARQQAAQGHQVVAHHRHGRIAGQAQAAAES